MTLVIHLTHVEHFVDISRIFTHVKGPGSASQTCAADKKHSKVTRASRGVKQVSITRTKIPGYPLALTNRIQLAVCPLTWIYKAVCQTIFYVNERKKGLVVPLLVNCVILYNKDRSCDI